MQTFNVLLGMALLQYAMARLLLSMDSLLAGPAISICVKYKG